MAWQHNHLTFDIVQILDPGFWNVTYSLRNISLDSQRPSGPKSALWSNQALLVCPLSSILPTRLHLKTPSWYCLTLSISLIIPRPCFTLSLFCGQGETVLKGKIWTTHLLFGHHGVVQHWSIPLPVLYTPLSQPLWDQPLSFRPCWYFSRNTLDPCGTPFASQVTTSCICSWCRCTTTNLVEMTLTYLNFSTNEQQHD